MNYNRKYSLFHLKNYKDKHRQKYSAYSGETSNTVSNNTTVSNNSSCKSHGEQLNQVKSLTYANSSNPKKQIRPTKSLTNSLIKVIPNKEKTKRVLSQALSYTLPQNLVEKMFTPKEKLKLSSSVRKIISFAYRRKLIENRKWCCLIFSLALSFGLVANLALAYYETQNFDVETNDINTSDNPHLTRAILGIKITTTITTIFSVILSLYYHWNELQLYKFDNNLSYNTMVLSFDQPGYFVLVVVEILAILVHPLYVKDNGTNFYKTESLYFLMLLRIPLIFRYFIAINRLFYSAKVQTVANLNRFSIGKMSYENVRLIVRTNLEQRPVKILVVGVLTNWFSVAYLLFLAETRYNLNPKNIENLSGITNYLDSLWVAPVTFTTIGYGDFSPKSYWGRSFMIYLGLLGAICTSMLVAIMSDNLTMNRHEKMMYSTLNKSDRENELKHKAAILLQRIVRQKIRNKKTVIERPISFIQESIDIEKRRSILSIQDPNEITNQNHSKISEKRIPATVKNVNFKEALEIHHGDAGNSSSSNSGGTSNEQNSNNSSSDDIGIKAKGYCPVIYSKQVLEAIVDFSKIRRKIKFRENQDATRMVDLQISYNRLNDRVKIMENKLGSVENNLTEVLRILKKEN